LSTNGRTATAQRNGGNQQRNSYGAYGILTEFVSTATAKRNAGNQALV